MALAVSDPVAFVQDPAARRALVAGIAQLSGAPPNCIEVALFLSRRLAPRGAALRTRALAHQIQLGGNGNVLLEYTITIPAIATSESADEGNKGPGTLSAHTVRALLQSISLQDVMDTMSGMVHSHIGFDYTISVTSVQDPAVRAVATTSITTHEETGTIGPATTAEAQLNTSTAPSLTLMSLQIVSHEDPFVTTTTASVPLTTIRITTEMSVAGATVDRMPFPGVIASFSGILVVISAGVALHCCRLVNYAAREHFEWDKQGFDIFPRPHSLNMGAQNVKVHGGASPIMSKCWLPPLAQVCQDEELGLTPTDVLLELTERIEEVVDPEEVVVVVVASDACSDSDDGAREYDSEDEEDQYVQDENEAVGIFPLMATEPVRASEELAILSQSAPEVRSGTDVEQHPCTSLVPRKKAMDLACVIAALSYDRAAAKVPSACGFESLKWRRQPRHAYAIGGWRNAIIYPLLGRPGAVGCGLEGRMQSAHIACLQKQHQVQRKVLCEEVKEVRRCEPLKLSAQSVEDLRNTEQDEGESIMLIKSVPTTTKDMHKMGATSNNVDTLSFATRAVMHAVELAVGKVGGAGLYANEGDRLGAVVDCPDLAFAPVCHCAASEDTCRHDRGLGQVAASGAWRGERLSGRGDIGHHANGCLAGLPRLLGQHEATRGTGRHAAAGTFHSPCDSEKPALTSRKHLAVASWPCEGATAFDTVARSPRRGARRTAGGSPGRGRRAATRGSAL